MSLQFGYWKTRGYGHPIRQLLYITKLEFEHITWGDKAGWRVKKEEVFGEGDQLPNCLPRRWGLHCDRIQRHPLLHC